MTTISSHILDTALGRPAEGLAVKLEALDDDGAARTLAERTTNDDGRVTDLAAAGIGPGAYRITFETGAYHRATGQQVFYPSVEVVFRVDAAADHLHIPLLLSPFGYSTYRGS
jgi:5-hydroxyisourate hydrolase